MADIIVEWVLFPVHVLCAIAGLVYGFVSGWCIGFGYQLMCQFSDDPENCDAAPYIVLSTMITFVVIEITINFFMVLLK